MKQPTVVGRLARGVRPRAAEAIQSTEAEKLKDALNAAEALDSLMRVGKAHGITEADRDRVRLAAACRRFASALDILLDGEQDHDINPGELGMTRDDCDRVIAARAEARALLMIASQ